MPLRLFLLVTLVALTGCSTMSLDDFESTAPAFRPDDYFLGHTRAWGFFEDRFGKIRREFTVDMDGAVENDLLTLDEHFIYSDGERQARVWKIRRLGDGRYEGRAGDIIGVAEGRAVGRAMRWSYDVDLPVGDSRWRVHFDDWMLLQDEDVMLNRSTVTKLGFTLGQVVIFFTKAGTAGPTAEAERPIVSRSAAE